MPHHFQYRTTFCSNWSHCTKGTRCEFIHPTPDQVVQFPPFQISAPFELSNLVPQFLSAGTQTHAPSASHEEEIQFPTLNSSSVPNIDKPIVRPRNYKTRHCRHFSRKNGWCPRGNGCNFIHDENMLNSPDDHAMQESSASLSTESLSRIISGGVRIASPRVHCWAYVQGLCQNPVCPYVHPRDIAPFIIHTPCLTWPKCGGPFICRFQHSVATIPPAPVSDPVDPAPIALPARQIRMTAPVTEYTVSPNSTLVSGPESTIPAGAYQLDGTTYFPLDVFNPQISCVPTASEIQGNAAPSHNWTHHYDDDRMNRTPQRRGVASHRKARSEWVQPPTTPVEAHIDLPRTQQHAADDRLTSTSDNEFPYRPPKNQRVGHARRISVTIKRT